LVSSPLLKEDAMLDYVQSGNMDTSLHAKSHKHAAMMTIRDCECELGVITVVSEKRIEDDASDHVYFHTENIIEECAKMRLVG
jgi:hypothetical protein